MSNFDELLTNNALFAASDAKDRVPAIPFLPNKQVYIITCIDPRVDPAALLGLSLGDAIVARNVGGRVTDDALADLGWISYLHEDKTPDAPWFELVVIHHTDCGSALMADDQLRAGFVDRGFDDAELRRTAVVEPAITVAQDTRRIVESPFISAQIAVSGYTYDVHTGLLTQVVDQSRVGVES
ncbi:carbonic anhydrase [Mycobacterium sp. CBMA293]|uniref:carbonic anhydrase n=1 Tax=unclassified Mycolicibacterium TaxID=2636767 RepID=UPI0012DE71DA|nr:MULTISPECIES: carbonic anhydrase [unclassified Mycolicibacterium]MUL48267.1 carbonic anhydrase [Mycolicibacterium sp. CBMA 360]MUL57565.1 carbonic anhydrase [Mycolicibacterium sp. CBMA 335]MUL70605.1 carbonic anhydrase [Mycolicibacterium sp. CBMA 311]MUL92653.1 carbonic anhydrase [Mycolicibacterium sp. CBMA 230]MUM08334.1 carbonic anhydrase [Mycolicibacterium sp. CBMA 213]